MAAPRIGDIAPDFTLEGTEGTFELSKHRGRPVVLLFYPGDDTTVCTRQFCSYRDAGEELGELDAVFVGISPQGLDSKEAFKVKYGLTTPLLADPGGKVSRAYGFWSQRMRMTKRGVAIVDEEGRIAHLSTNFLSLGYEDPASLRETLEAVA